MFIYFILLLSCFSASYPPKTSPYVYLFGEWVPVMGEGPIGVSVMGFTRIVGGRVIALDDVNEYQLAFWRERLGIVVHRAAVAPTTAGFALRNFLKPS